MHTVYGLDKKTIVSSEIACNQAYNDHSRIKGDEGRKRGADRSIQQNLQQRASTNDSSTDRI